MKIGKFFKAIVKMFMFAVALGCLAYIITDILDRRASDNFDDTWDDEFDEDFDDLFDDDAPEDAAGNREYVKIDPSKMAAETCEE